MANLESILKKSQDKSNPSLLPEELSYLISAFLPDQPADDRSKAYMVLSAFCQGVRTSAGSTDCRQSDAATEKLSDVLGPPVISRLGDVEANTVLAGVSFLGALFRVDQESAASIFQRDGVVESVADSVDLFSSSSNLALEVSHLLGQACGHKKCRPLIPSQSLQWLETQIRQSSNVSLRSASAVALVKLSRGRASDDSPSTSSEPFQPDHEFTKLLKRIIMDGNDQMSFTDAVEGLAYLSVDPVVKEDLSHDSAFLSRLFSISPRRSRTPLSTQKAINSTLLYGIVVIITNICTYPPRLNEEQEHVRKLRRMAQKGERSPEAEAEEAKIRELEDDEHCRKRVRKLVECGAVDVLSSAVSASDSHGVRLSAGKAFLGIIEDKDNRGKVLQGGGSKALKLILGQILPSASSKPTQSPRLGADELAVIQALAKLSITSPPFHVFGPNQGSMFDAIRPLTILLLDSSSTLLQRFEAMMALTNLSSESPESASRIADTENVMNKVEFYLLEDHVLIRRAAMELICNLIAGSDDVFERYSREERMSSSKLLIVLALCDVDDLQTRLAASGALATLTSAPTACRALFGIQRERRRALPILTQLIDPSSMPPAEEVPPETDPGLIHRGAICARNFLLSIGDPNERNKIFEEAQKVGLQEALTKVVQAKEVNEAVIIPAKEALGWFAEAPKIK